MFKRFSDVTGDRLWAAQREKCILVAEQIDRKVEAARLAAIRARLAALDGQDWLRVHDGESERLEARGPDGAPAVLARFCADAAEEEKDVACGALDDERFLLGLVDRAISASRAATPASPADPPAGRFADGTSPSGGGKDYAAEAAMKCAEPGFKKYLEECHGLERPLTDDRVAARLRHVLGIGSRRELNSDSVAARRWRQLVGDFDAWRRRG